MVRSPVGVSLRETQGVFTMSNIDGGVNERGYGGLLECFFEQLIISGNRDHFWW